MTVLMLALSAMAFSLSGGSAAAAASGKEKEFNLEERKRDTKSRFMSFLYQNNQGMGRAVTGASLTPVSMGGENDMPLFCRGLDVCGAMMEIICLYNTIACSAFSMMV